MKVRHNLIKPFSLVLTILIAFGLYTETLKVGIEEHTQISDIFLQLKELEANLDLEVMQVTSFLMVQYDPLIETRRKILQLESQLITNDDNPFQNTNAKVKRALKVYLISLSQKLNVMEHIKSHAAVTQNGLQYLPTAVKNLENTEGTARSDFAGLISRLSLYTLFPSKSELDGLHSKLNNLKHTIDSNQRPHEQISNILFHAQNLLKHLSKLVGLKNLYLSVPSKKRFIELSREYDEYFAKVTERVANFNLLLLIITILCLLALYRVLYRLGIAHKKANNLWNRLHDAVESISDAFALYDHEGHLILRNRRWLTFYPWLKDHVKPGTHVDMVDAKNSKYLTTEYLDPDESGGKTQVSKRKNYLQQLEDGRWFMANDDQTSDGGTVCVRKDVTESKIAEIELKKLLRAVEASSSIVLITDVAGNIEYINPKFTEITGYSKDEAVGKNPRILNSGLTEKEIYCNLWKTIISGKEWKGEFHNRKKDGSFYWGRASISGVKNEKGVITHYIAIQDDVTHQYKLSEQLTYQASHDTLTGLVNRREFENRVERLLVSKNRGLEKHALCYLDLDQFKVVNDTCGHIAGDQLLLQLSNLLKDIVRHRDTLARLGGDEFGVLMEHCSLEDAERVTSSLLKAVQTFHFTWEGQPFIVGVSIGLVAIDENTIDLTQLMKDADAACYMAKDTGRNRVHVYHIEDSDLAKRHGEMQWVSRIHQALEEDRFCLHAQSIVPLNDQTYRHYELLIRLKDEKGKLIFPNAFLPAAERYGLIIKIDKWVIEKAFNLMSLNPDFLERVKFVSINLSGPSIVDSDVIELIFKKLKETGISGEKFCFEITETAAISNLSRANNFVAKLREVGCKFALDDFGSGLSSFGYLKTLSVNYLKIDGMFVKDIVEDPIDHAIVKSINEIGQVMDMKTIAEFVENDQILAELEKIGVNYAQGYQIDKPRPLDDIINEV
ncbi:MAG: EAL domain-containing protein [Proteobacteria bacterium]|nr:EAL domain-containing protein [Pseudomonadota bacterium]